MKIVTDAHALGSCTHLVNICKVPRIVLVTQSRLATILVACVCVCFTLRVKVIDFMRYNYFAFSLRNRTLDWFHKEASELCLKET